ncbi:ABC transporter ATP-binding protein [Oceanicola sp. 502str15]|uniref:ABC transporter ATP-binding protein n=1 Tax=Oceanicola sp. 502str15 TaxID=2696061 RepID=UPI002095878D|nr:ABC transporter ATP-binding protein [Oceanicola sp. 502str15]MCO6384643.1 ATP-binding cassette domain-containing protein [Oceanicola sp. 502str15]
MADALRLENVTAGYGPTHVLNGIDLVIPRGERLAVIGRNGAGKTTLLATMMGLTKLHGGTVSLNGQAVSALPPHRRNAAGLGLVPQTRDIFKSLSVEENLLAAQRGEATLEEAYALFPRLKERRRNGGGQLSGGEQQMLAIARTLMTGPQTLLLDEPLEGLAPVICEQLMQVFEGLAAEGRTVVLVEQHAEAALNFASRALIMTGGAIVHDGPASALKGSDLLERHIGVALAT